MVFAAASENAATIHNKQPLGIERKSHGTAHRDIRIHGPVQA